METSHKKLVSFVSNAHDWENFSTYLDTLISAAYSKLEAATATEEVWRQLGQIKAYRTVQRLRKDLTSSK
jgi:hypothetical protein